MIFSINNSDVGSAVTNKSGVASLSNVSLGGVNAGSYPSGVKARFTGDYTYPAANASASLAISKITSLVTWANPAEMRAGTALSSVQLNATASVPGTFTYTPSAGTILSEGNGQTLSVLFTPNDILNYTNASSSVTINVYNCYPLTLTFTGQGATPTAIPAYSTGCSNGQYRAEESIQLNGAVPADGWQIQNWTGTSNDSSTSNTNTLSMPAKAATVKVNYVDLTPPNTAITGHPNDPSNVANATFSFTGTESNSTFECKFDSSSPSSCTSPKIYTNLSEGSHTFEVTAIDPQGNVNLSPAGYTWEVNAVNDTPVITGQNSLSINEDTALTITLTNLIVQDPDSAYPSEFSLTILPGENYTTSGSTVTPKANFNGTLTVPVKVSDGATFSAPYNLTVIVNSINDAPIADSKSLNMDEGTSLTITLSGSDIENSPLTYTVTTSPSHGSLTGIAPNLIYTPSTKYAGLDAWKYKVNDGTLNSTEVTVTIAVNDVLPKNVEAGGPYNTTVGTEVTLHGSAICTPTDNCTLAWDLDNDGLYDDASGKSPTYTWNTPSSYAIKLRVSDDDGNIVTSTSALTISFTMPTPDMQNPFLKSGALYSDSLTSQFGTTSGSPSSLNLFDQSGTQDNPDAYVSFQTLEDTFYLGYQSFTLPEDAQAKLVSTMLLQVNFQAPASPHQVWTWSIYNWSTGMWIPIGDTVGTTPNEWQTLLFHIRQPRRYISAAGEVRIQLLSENTGGAVKIDYQALHITYLSFPATATPEAPLITSDRPSIFSVPSTPRP
ncbi:MAG: Ig-like domain-containing protein [Anaerolineales bacterium]